MLVGQVLAGLVLADCSLAHPGDFEAGERYLSPSLLSTRGLVRISLSGRSSRGSSEGSNNISSICGECWRMGRKRRDENAGKYYGQARAEEEVEQEEGNTAVNGQE